MYRLVNVSVNPAGRFGAPETEPGPSGTDGEVMRISFYTWYCSRSRIAGSVGRRYPGPQVSQGRTSGVFRARLLRLVLLDHDQPVASLMQRVQFNARLVVDPGDCLLEGCDHLGAVPGDGKGRDDDSDAHVRCFLPPGIIPLGDAA